ncbi:MAG: hypothetical protein ACREOU_07880 [Candidatus Eiseniibacteriota bacterium]
MRSSSSGHPNLRARWSLLGLLFLIVSLPNCRGSKMHYLVELRPVPDGMERRLTCSSPTGKRDSLGQAVLDSVPATTLAHLRASYAKGREEQHGLEHTFTDTFAVAPPRDLGGWGSFASLRTDLGTGWSFIERTQGNDRPLPYLEWALASVDRSVRLLMGWTRFRLGSPARLPSWADSLRVGLREDMRNLVLYFAVASTTDYSDYEERIAQYVLERGYVEHEEFLLGKDVDDPSEWDEEDSEDVFAGYVRARLRSSGYATIADSIARLLNQRTHLAALERFAQRSPECRPVLARWRRTDPDFERSELLSLFAPGDEVWEDAEAGDSSAESPVEWGDVRCVLELPVDPVETNGTRHYAARLVEWESSLGDTGELPFIRNAMWAVPDTATQLRYFGAVVLSGKKLIDYARWEAGLDADRRAQWDSLRVTLGPENYVQRLEGFRFHRAAADADTGLVPPDETLARLFGPDSTIKE